MHAAEKMSGEKMQRNEEELRRQIAYLENQLKFKVPSSSCSASLLLPILSSPFFSSLTRE
jgi:hypothetical protein